MKKSIFIILFSCSIYLYANPNNYVQECISWIGRNENSLIEIGALNSGPDVDLREYGLKLLRYFVWAKDNIGYWAQTSDGNIVIMRCNLLVSGIEKGSSGYHGQIRQKYKNKRDFDADAEEIRQMVYANNGRLLSTSDLVGIRSISYEYFIGNYKISPEVFIYLENAELKGYGWIDIQVERR